MFVRAVFFFCQQTSLLAAGRQVKRLHLVTSKRIFSITQLLHLAVVIFRSCVRSCESPLAARESDFHQLLVNTGLLRLMQ